MKIIEPGYVIEHLDSGEDILRRIELAGRTCYKSEDKITSDSSKDFAKMLMRVGHESVVEHSSMTVRFICDRGVTHEIVRHRLVAFSQESTRYCNYGAGKFGKEITVIKPVFWKEEDKQYHYWVTAMSNAESNYLSLIESGASAQEARSVLPNSLKTEIVCTANLREWRHIFKMRAVNKKAHPQMRQLMIPLLKEVQQRVPILFDDLIVEE